MDDKNIREYAQLMQELGLTGLEIRKDGSLRLEREGQPVAAPAASAQQKEESPAPESGLYEVKSPMVGVFYASPEESAAPYVAPGSRVRRGDVLCLIEAMKLMNEVTAERDGIVAEVCAQSGQIVDYGKPLFRMKEVPA
jgi:acetyl-CoA carboxylase biotin carboxyl carrier protein